ncbi:MAG: hypothetical protein AABY64_09385 [Bdellovibrionota bacterium]
MLVNEYDVVLVSAFRNCYWLASELRRQKLKVLIIDLSSKLGLWPPEDIEGPFGLFKTETLKGSLLEGLWAEESFHEVGNGFTIWLDSGPIEFKGPLTRYQIEMSGLDPKLFETLGRQTGIQVQKNFHPDTLNFDTHWLIPFSCQLASTTYCGARNSVDLPRALPLAANFYVRWANRNANEKAANWLKTQGISFSDKTDIIDLSFENRKKITGVELKGEISGLVRCKAFVWGLTSEESYFYNSVLGQEIFPTGPLESEWSWIRYRVKIKPNAQTRQWPLHFCSFQDKDSSWTHENMILWQKTSLDEFLEAWVRLPTVQRFNKNYLSLIGERILKKMSSRVSGLDAEIQNQPQEYTYTYHQLGPSRFPIFKQNSTTTRWKSNGVKNFFSQSHERLHLYSHESRQELAEENLKSILHWLVELETKRRKEAEA